MDDYEIQEIRRIRQQIYSENKPDLKAVAEYYRQIENELRNSGQYKFIDEKAHHSNRKQSSHKIA
ncbi:MAG TPA: hypothetical protein DCM38_00825 [Gammaproteobacteria bacterium]|nr:hypothetical protein [Gammaproteobacteria bacterium]